jgi:hypothetical protein
MRKQENKRKFQKRKQRERETQKMLNRRRIARIKLEKKEKEFERLKEAASPSMKLLPFHKQKKPVDAESVQEQIMKNMQMLAALEEEYEKEKSPDKPDLFDAIKKSGVGILNTSTGLIEEAAAEVVENVVEAEKVK